MKGLQCPSGIAFKDDTGNVDFRSTLCDHFNVDPLLCEGAEHPSRSAGRRPHSFSDQTENGAVIMDSHGPEIFQFLDQSVQFYRTVHCARNVDF